MAWVITATVTSAALTGYSAYSATNAANDAADAQQDNARRKYLLESGVASNQMEEQQSIAMEQMTEVSREFLKAKSAAEAQQAESGVAGVSAQRAKMVMTTKEGEAKGKVAKEVDTNVINIAQGMLASKIDTDAIIAEAQSKKKNVAFETILGGIQGGLQGYSLGKSLGGTSTTSTQSLAEKQYVKNNFTDTNFSRGL